MEISMVHIKTFDVIIFASCIAVIAAIISGAI